MLLAEQVLEKYKVSEEEKNKKSKLELEELYKFIDKEKEKAEHHFNNFLKQNLTNEILNKAEDKYIQLEILKEKNRNYYNNHLYELIKKWLIDEGFVFYYENTLYESFKIRIGVK